MPEPVNTKDQIIQLFEQHNLSVPESKIDLFEKFVLEEENIAALNSINENKNKLMANWKLKERVAEIASQPLRIPNGGVGKPYTAPFDLSVLGKDVSAFEVGGLEELGLQYDEQLKQITGSPIKSGDFNINVKFKIEGQAEDEPLNEKRIPLVINPDPKSLWKNIESDKNDPYWKENDITIFQPISDRYLLASSKRGRAHANVGSFREDDFAVAELENGWSIVVVSDGAGSAKLSRQGSKLACQELLSFFSTEESTQGMKEFDPLLEQQDLEGAEDNQNKIKLLVCNNLGKAAFSVHKKLEEFAAKESILIKDLNCTFVFTLFKKYSSGYALLSFGVGDCPMAVLNRDVTEVTLLNWIDVGEFGGGTRFITMSEIFKNENFATRFSFKQLPDFSYLILMSDGIYDPKFVVEANLGDLTKWQAFLEDLGGKNEEGVKVELSAENDQIAEQLSKWMDFWSVGNHDDRTLAIVF